MMICVTALNGASSSTYSPASAPNEVISSITLYIGFRCPTTPIEATTVTAANTKNANTLECIGLFDPQHQGGSRHEIHHGDRQEPFPAERHQLVVAIPRERPPHPHVKKQNQKDLDEEP